MDDRRFLTVRSLARSEGGLDVISSQSFDAEVAELSGEQALAGNSEPVRRLRALIDPTRLAPRIELETERRIRRTIPRWFARARYELIYDVVTVRHRQLAKTFQELKIRRVARGRPDLDRVAQVLTERHGLRSLLVGKLDRAKKALRDLESEALTRATQADREVALLVLADNGLALRANAGTLSIPVRAGSGEDGCRHLLHACFGTGDGQVRLLGTAPATGTRPLLEVWLARRGSRDVRGGREGAGAQFAWLAPDEVMARAGSPVLRDARTLAALTVATRSAVLPEWCPPPPPPDTGGASRRSRVSLIIPAARPSVSAPLDAARLAPEQVLNGEVSQLEFCARVLELAESPAVPLLARVRFLAICSANLDEFFMVRVGALKRALAAGTTDRTEDGLTAAERLEAIALRLRPLVDRQKQCVMQSLLPALASRGIRLLRWADLTEPQRERLRAYFTEQVFPQLSPQAITQAPGHPFPLIPNLRLSLAVIVSDPRTGPLHFAYVKLPDAVPRFTALDDGRTFVALEDIVRENVGAVYPGRRVNAAYAFMVTRGGELALDERHAVDLLQVIDEEAKRRPYGAPVRVEVERAMPPAVRELLLRELQFEDASQGSPLGPGDVMEAEPLVGLGSLRELADLPVPELQYAPFRGQAPVAPGRSMFSLLAERDLLVHHPYDQFEATVERFLGEAADDPDVIAIRLTLYRAGGRSAIVDALARAAQGGKEVFVFVELKARFDEARNIEWAKKLEEVGIHVVYGLVSLKTHAKTALVVRRERDAVRRYVHIGTGNYNATTAALYTDLGLLSSDEALGADVHDFFNELSGSSRPPGAEYRRILVAPTHLLSRFLTLIGREADHARGGRGGRIRVKLNGLADAEIVAALYDAAQAGVEIDLVVRGICCLRPGVTGLSENIRVVSLLGRFLEHARIFHFANGGDDEYYIGSADWRPRNLRRRVEVVTPVSDPACRRRLDHILALELADPTAWELRPDGSYERRTPVPGQDPRSAQEKLMALVTDHAGQA